MAAIANVNTNWGYELSREPVAGTNLPYYGTGPFQGEIDIEGFGSSDNRWEALVITASGQLRDWNVVMIESDTQGTASGRAWALSGVRFTEYHKIWERDNIIKYRARGIMTIEPTAPTSGSA